jgi:NAD(P)-dependent dehydrogenase (short-subunit alcohol dehydrogenase family)
VEKIYGYQLMKRTASRKTASAMVAPRPHLGRLIGRVAWVSGATSGIGEATARLFAAEGAYVAVVGRRQQLARRIVDEIIREGGKAIAIKADVGDEAAVEKSLRETIKHFGRLDILVNNAGMVDVKQLHDYTGADWDRVMKVNLKSMFFAFKHAVPQFRRQGRGWVVNVGSISSFVGQAGTPVYTTSKHAIVGLTKSIALDYAAMGVRCNCICPGITDTPMLREHLNATPNPEATLAARLKRVPMGVALTPMDVARSILFFSCDDSAGVTGASLVIDCGYIATAEWETKGKTAFQESQ